MVVTGTIVDVTTVALVLREKEVESPPLTEMVATGTLVIERLVNVVVTGAVGLLLDALSAACCLTAMLGGGVGDGSGTDRRHLTCLWSLRMVT